RGRHPGPPARSARVLSPADRRDARADAALPRAVRALVGDVARRAVPPARAGRAQRAALRRALRLRPPCARAARPGRSHVMALPTEPELPLAVMDILDFSWVGVG